MYTAVKRFRHFIEGRNFIIYTDHKPLTFAFNQSLDKCSPRQFRHLDYIGQFTTDIRHINGIDNSVADALSRIETLSQAPDHNALEQAQANDPELKEILKSDATALCLKKTYFPGFDVSLYCDSSNETVRPYIPMPLRRAVFDSLHGLSHPGVRATQKLVTKRFVWPSINKDCRNSGTTLHFVSAFKGHETRHSPHRRL